MAIEGRRDKSGRNDPCPCGSGKKYKKCHGESAVQPKALEKSSAQKIAFDQKFEEQKALEIQRQKQQGLGRPIISTYFKGNRFVAVGKQLHWSDKWKTFHDFLGDYIKLCFGKEWWFKELNKNPGERHPILKWSQLVWEYLTKHSEIAEKIHTAPMTGALQAYYGLAYNLYLLAHNVELQSKLITRLKNHDQFLGAYYETSVASIVIRAGFDLILEDETDISTSHCEFTATYRETAKKFSIEAKARHGTQASPRVGNQLYRALRKRADHQRVVFIELNVPDKASDQGLMRFVQELSRHLRDLEVRLKIDGNPAPEAYVLFTNFPYQYSLESTEFRSFGLAEGFKIPEFNFGLTLPNIREALRIREKHYEIYQLIKSFQEYSGIPSTFDGEIPDLVFGKTRTRLRIGEKYLVSDDTGKEVVGELTDAIVSDKQALGIYKLEDGRSVIVTCPLTEDELSAYQKHPDTFFGVYKPHGRRAETPLEFFDFMYKVYRKSPKQKLLDFLKDHPDFEKLQGESQEELALIYCERMAYAAFSVKK